ECLVHQLAPRIRRRSHILKLSIFFFFQAEDGIRDGHVTGVQTCALPIYSSPAFSGPACRRRVTSQRCATSVHLRKCAYGVPETRSEERRVGKECRSRWSQYH